MTELKFDLHNKVLYKLELVSDYEKAENKLITNKLMLIKPIFKGNTLWENLKPSGNKSEMLTVSEDTTMKIKSDFPTKVWQW